MIPKSTGLAREVTSSSKPVIVIVVSNWSKFKKHYEKAKLSINLFDKLYRKRLQNIAFDQKAYEFLRKVFIEKKRMKSKCSIWKTQVFNTFLYSNKKINGNFDKSNLAFCATVRRDNVIFQATPEVNLENLPDLCVLHFLFDSLKMTFPLRFWEKFNDVFSEIQKMLV